MPRSKTTKRGREARADAQQRRQRAHARLRVAAVLRELADWLKQATPEDRAQYNDWIQSDPGNEWVRAIEWLQEHPRQYQ